MNAPPVLIPFDTGNGPSQEWVRWIGEAYQTLRKQAGYGTTAQRPPNGLLIGDIYYDTTLVKPIWWNGTVWKDATGATV